MHLHRTGPFALLIAVVCAVAGVADAGPPSLAKSRKVASRWLRDARKGRAPSKSSSDIEVAIDSIECHGVFHHDALQDAADCIARTFRGYRMGPWSTFIVAGDERSLRGDATSEDGSISILVKVDDHGQVTEVRVGY
jgi:hypothetical protein